jgi:hypothetical protein
MVATTTDRVVLDDASGRTLIRWGAVAAGVVIGLALMALLSALWLALAYGSEIEEVRNNLSWFLGGSALGCLFVVGMLAGYLSGVRGAGPGLLHGLTVWGTLMIVTLTIGIPSILNVFNLGQVVNAATGPDGGLVTGRGADGALWATFWTLLIGIAAAGIGGMIGGAATRGQRTESEQTSATRYESVGMPPATTLGETRPDRSVAQRDSRALVDSDGDGVYVDENGRTVEIDDAAARRS